MSDEPSPLSGDPEVVKQLISELREWHRKYVDDFSSLTQRSADYNKQIASFHERLLLISLGTIGLSVTALTSLVPKLPLGAFPRMNFIFLITPAWLLLLASAIMSAAAIGHMVAANQIGQVELRRTIRIQNLSAVLNTLRNLSGNLSGTVTVESQVRDVSTMFSELANEVEKELSQVYNPDSSMVKKFNEATFAWLSRWTLRTLYLGLILLCFSAISLFIFL